MAEQEKLWNRNYKKVMAVNFCLSFAFYLITPLLPVYLSETFHSTKDTIGIIDIENLDFSNVRTIHVLPVFLNGANFAQANVPEDLKETLRQNGASFVN